MTNQEVEHPSIPGFDLDTELNAPRVEALLFYDAANQTKDGKTNLLGIYDRVFVPSLGGAVSLNMFLRAAKTFPGTIIVAIISPDGNEVSRGKIVAKEEDLADNSIKPSHVQAFLKIEFEVPIRGIYWFVVTYNDRIIGGSRLSVELSEE